MSRKTLIPLFIWCACACGTENKPAPPTETETKAYETVIATRQPVKKNLQLTGEILPNQKATIISKVNGYVKRISADIGQRVTKGQTLAPIDAPEMSFQVAEAGSRAKQAYSRLAASKSTYQRLITASATPGAVALNEIDQAKNQMDADSQAYAAATAAKNSSSALGGYLVIKAPFNGIVTVRAVNSGDYVNNTGNNLLFEVEDVERLRLQVAVPEAYTATVLPGDSATSPWHRIPAWHSPRSWCANRVRWSTKRAAKPGSSRL